MPRKSRDMQQTGLSLPRDLHQRLQEAANHNGHSLGEEIRQRLEESFAKSYALVAGDDPKTKLLASLIERLAWSLAIDGHWHEDPYSFQVFKAAIDRFQPPPDAPPPKPRMMYGRPGEPAELVGRTLAESMIRDLDKLTFANREEG
jgi:hypothetical protein